jgi:hypothetical protein
VCVLTDFVVADDSDAQKLGDKLEAFDPIDAKGLGQIEMGTLYAILSDTEYDESFLVDDESFAYTASDDGPWVQRVPEDMVRRLAAMTDDDLPRIAEAWSETEEFDPKYFGWNRGDIDEFLP